MLCTGGSQRPPVVCLHVVPTVCTVCVCMSTLELVDFRALRVHVRVIERVACGVALGRQQVLGRVSVRGLWRVVRTGVKSQIWESGG